MGKRSLYSNGIRSTVIMHLGFCIELNIFATPRESTSSMGGCPYPLMRYRFVNLVLHEAGPWMSREKYFVRSCRTDP